jgi:hypothetical protein
MVQHYEISFSREAGSSSYQLNKNFWKLADYPLKPGHWLQGLLQLLNYAFEKSANVARLRYLVSRAERGLISYSGRSLAELKSF